MLLLIDNYDSFTYNLYQLIGTANPHIRVVRNDELSVAEIERLAPSRLVLSPGPGRPDDAGVCKEAVKKLSGKIPILGVCLGLQVIFEAYGGAVSYAKELMHGKKSMVELDNESGLFKGLPRVIDAARYHSLAAVRETMPGELAETARTADGEIMAVSHRKYNLHGVQFHPESVLTPLGHKIIENFLALR